MLAALSDTDSGSLRGPAIGRAWDHQTILTRTKRKELLLHRQRAGRVTARVAPQHDQMRGNASARWLHPRRRGPANATVNDSAADTQTPKRFQQDERRAQLNLTRRTGSAKRRCRLELAFRIGR